MRNSFVAVRWLAVLALAIGMFGALAPRVSAGVVVGTPGTVAVAKVICETDNADLFGATDFVTVIASELDDCINFEAGIGVDITLTDLAGTQTATLATEGAFGEATFDVTTPLDFTLTEDSTDALSGTFSLLDGQSAQVTIINYVEISNEIVVTKSNEDGSDPIGVGFTVFATIDDGAGNLSCNLATEVAAEAFVTDEVVSGVASVTFDSPALVEGASYCVSETTVPTEFTAGADQIVTIEGGIAVADFLNVADVDPVVGTITVNTINSDDTVPVGVGFTVYGATDNGDDTFSCDTSTVVLAEQIAVATAGSLTATTVFSSDLLVEGEFYCVVETTGIGGYTATPAEGLAAITDGVATFDFVNELDVVDATGSVQINKSFFGPVIGADSGAEICFDFAPSVDGAPGDLLGIEECILAADIDPETGTATLVFDAVPVGDSFVVETSTAAGYDLAAPVPVTVVTGDVATEVDVENLGTEFNFGIFKRVCEDATRVGEADFFVVAFNPADTPNCFLPEGPVAFTLTNTETEESVEGETDAEGFLGLQVESGTFTLSEAFGGVTITSEPFEINGETFNEATVVNYVAPAAAGGDVLIQKFYCEEGGPGVEFEVSDPIIVEAADGDDGVAGNCEPGPASFLIYPFGDEEAAIAVEVDDDGSVLLPGIPATTEALHVLVEVVDGEAVGSAEFAVAEGGLTAIDVFNYAAGVTEVPATATATTAPATEVPATATATATTAPATEVPATATATPTQVPATVAPTTAPGAATVAPTTIPVTALPATGAGYQGSEGYSLVWILATALAIFGFFGIGFGLKRRVARVGR